MTNVLRSALLVAGAVVLIAPSSPAATLSYSPGDLMLGFHATGGTGATQDYLLDIGQASLYTSATGSFTLSIGNFGADLSSVFGANWMSRTDLFWSVVGTPGNLTAVGNDVAKTLYATVAEITTGTLATPWVRGSSSAQGSVANSFTALGQAYGSIAGVPNTSTANSPVGLIQQTTDTNSYAFFQPEGGPSFSYFNPTTEGTPAATLDLIRLLPGSPGTPGSTVGTFKINGGASPTIVFNAVPEPSSAALLAIAVGVLSAASRRRRRPAQSSV